MLSSVVKNILLTWLQVEKFVAPADNHNTAGQYNPGIHPTSGAVFASLPGFSTTIDSRVIAASQQLSAEFPFKLDQNDGSPLGIGWTQNSIGGGKRSSSATAYLQNGQINRPNLHVLLNAQVTKLVKTGVANGLPSFRAVQFASKDGGKYFPLFWRTLPLI